MMQRMLPISSLVPVNIQGWFPLGLTGLISLQSKGLLRVLSNTAVWKHQLFSAQNSLWSNSHPYMTIGKNIPLTIWTFVGKVMPLLSNILINITFKPVVFVEIKLPTIMWVGLVQSVEGLNRPKTDVPWTRRNSASRLPLDLSCKSPCISSLLAYPKEFGLDRLHNCVSQVLKINPSKHTHTHTHTHISCWFCFSGEP